MEEEMAREWGLSRSTAASRGSRSGSGTKDGGDGAADADAIVLEPLPPPRRPWAGRRRCRAVLAPGCRRRPRGVLALGHLTHHARTAAAASPSLGRPPPLSRPPASPYPPRAARAIGSPGLGQGPAVRAGSSSRPRIPKGGGGGAAAPVAADVAAVAGAAAAGGG
jgi:hypothetical protein